MSETALFCKIKNLEYFWTNKKTKQKRSNKNSTTTTHHLIKVLISDHFFWLPTFFFLLLRFGLMNAALPQWRFVRQTRRPCGWAEGNWTLPMKGSTYNEGNALFRSLGTTTPNTHVRLCVCVCVCVCVLYVRMYVCVCMNVCMYVCKTHTRNAYRMLPQQPDPLAAILPNEHIIISLRMHHNTTGLDQHTILLLIAPQKNKNITRGRRTSERHRTPQQPHRFVLFCFVVFLFVAFCHPPTHLCVEQPHRFVLFCFCVCFLCLFVVFVCLFVVFVCCVCLLCVFVCHPPTHLGVEVWRIWTSGSPCRREHPDA